MIHTALTPQDIGYFRLFIDMVLAETDKNQSIADDDDFNPPGVHNLSDMEIVESDNNGK